MKVVDGRTPGTVELMWESGTAWGTAIGAFCGTGFGLMCSDLGYDSAIGLGLIGLFVGVAIGLPLGSLIGWLAGILLGALIKNGLTRIQAGRATVAAVGIPLAVLCAYLGPLALLLPMLVWFATHRAVGRAL